MDAKELKYLVHEIAEKSDEVSFERLFRHYFIQLVDYIKAIIHHRPAAEDIAEDIFVNLWQNRHTLHTIKSIPYYLYAAAKNRAINHLTRDKNNKYVGLENIGEEMMVSYQTPENHLSGKEDLQMLMTAINNLPAKCQAIFRLVKEEGLGYKEVADILEVSQKTVENQMTIAFRKIFEATLQSGLRRNVKK